MKAVLLDIEGTTTPLAFVLEELFPYARTHLRRHLEWHQGSAEFDALVDRLRDERERDAAKDTSVPAWLDASAAARISSMVSYCEWLMDQDRKSTTLKEIQGRIWEDGYRRGELLGRVFDDVPGVLERWHAEGVAAGIFSSGSVLAQRMLFEHSSAGDLTRYLRCYFDTTTGPKGEGESYRRIADAMGIPAGDVIFVSDVTRELDAARDAGMRTRLAIRPGNAPVDDRHGHTEIRSLDEIGALTPGSPSE